VGVDSKQLYPSFFENELPQEVEKSNFFVEVPRILRRFWLAFLLCFVAIAALIILSTSLVPRDFQIYSWAVILPLA
jgi:hypothetical protein